VDLIELIEVRMADQANQGFLVGLRVVRAMAVIKGYCRGCVEVHVNIDQFCMEVIVTWWIRIRIPVMKVMMVILLVLALGY